MDALRNTCAENFLLADDPKCEELRQIRETAIANDFARDELCRRVPAMRARYEAQWQETERQLEERVAKLKIPLVTNPEKPLGSCQAKA